MNALLAIQLPVWASELLAWLSTGTNIASLFGIIATIVKIGSSRKESRAVTNKQISLLDTMIDRLADTKELATGVQTVSNQINDTLLLFEKSMTQQREANANLATFIMECFNRSNLSAEHKAELQLIADKIFYNDNTQVIEALKAAKLESDNAVSAGLEKIAQLEAELNAQKAKLTVAQENTKENRRV